MLLDILRYLIPNADCAYRGEPSNAAEYAQNVIWYDDRPQPSWDDVQAARPIVEKQIANDDVKNARASAYRSEADPLFFGWQRGENTEQEWLDKVAEIRARHPYAE